MTSSPIFQALVFILNNFWRLFYRPCFLFVRSVCLKKSVCFFTVSFALFIHLAICPSFCSLFRQTSRSNSLNHTHLPLNKKNTKNQTANTMKNWKTKKGTLQMLNSEYDYKVRSKIGRLLTNGTEMSQLTHHPHSIHSTKKTWNAKYLASSIRYHLHIWIVVKKKWCATYPHMACEICMTSFTGEHQPIVN